MIDPGEARRDPFAAVVEGLSLDVPEDMLTLLPIVRKGEGSVRIDALAGEAFRQRLCDVALEAELGRLVLPEPPKENSHIINAMADQLRSPHASPHAGDELAIRGVGLMPAWQSDTKGGAVGIGHGTTLFGVIQGVTYGEYQSGVAAGGESIDFNEMRVFDSDSAMATGPLLWLVNVAVCVGGGSSALDERLAAVLVPIAEPSIKLHTVHPVLPLPGETA